MKTKEIKNGSLYFNTKTNRVERVISNQFSNTRVVTEHHKREEGRFKPRTYVLRLLRKLRATSKTKRVSCGDSPRR